VIARHWTGRVRPEDVDAYVEYVRKTGVATQRATAGNLGSMVSVRRGDIDAEILVVSFWESLDAVHRFAGPDAETAVFYPEDGRFLVAADKTVTHYEIPLHALDPSLIPPAPGRAGAGAA